MKPALEAISVKTGYSRGRSELLSGLSFELFSGQLVAIIGANGSGKSTLLRTLGGIQRPLEGEVLMEGKNIFHLNAANKARLLALLFSGAPRLAGLKAKELVELGRHPHTGLFGKLKQKDVEEVQASMDLTGSLALAERNVDTLSDGEMQRVMLARLLAQQTPVLLLDEPTSFLDMPGKIELFQLLRLIAQTKNKLVLFSTHDLQLAMELADKILLLDGKGNYVFDTPAKVVKHQILKNFLPESLIKIEDGRFKILF